MWKIECGICGFLFCGEVLKRNLVWVFLLWSVENGEWSAENGNLAKCLGKFKVYFKILLDFLL